MRGVINLENIPHVIGIKKEMVEEMNMTEPIQSNFLVLANKFPGVRLIFRKRMIAIEPDTMIGILIQKIHLQETFSAKAR